jgi:hypothetical protein
MAIRAPKPPPPRSPYCPYCGTKLRFSARIRLRNGRVLYAKTIGKRVFRFCPNRACPRPRRGRLKRP